MSALAIVRSLVSARLKLIETTLPLYVYRPLLNAAELQAWMRQQGYPVPIPDMHVTIVYSTKPISWEAVPPDRRCLHVAGGDRAIEHFNGGATVLTFTSNHLQRRWQQFMDTGASFDYDQYRPHVTLSYENSVHRKPFLGNLYFGPEVFQEVQEVKV